MKVDQMKQNKGQHNTKDVYLFLLIWTIPNFLFMVT